MFRIYLLKQPRFFIQNLLIGIVFLLLCCFNSFRLKNHEINLNNQRISIIVYPDDLQFNDNYYHGKVFSEDLKQNVLISGYLNDKNEIDKIQSINSTQKWFVNADINTIDSPTNKNQFNSKAFYKSQNISNSLKIHHINNINTISTFTSKIHDFRYHLMKKINKLPPPLNLYGLSLIVGEMNSDFNYELSGIKQLGLIHLFSISGLHVYFVVSLLELILIYLRFQKEHSQIILFIFLPIYFIIAGSSVGLLRSVLMTGILLATKFLKFNLGSLDGWSLTFLINLFLYPQMLVQFGCQLSYALSLGLIFVNRYSFFKKTILMNFISLPIILYHIYHWHILTLFANLLILPFFSILVFPLVILGCTLGILLPFIADLIAWFLKEFDIIVNFVGNLPGDIYFGKPNLYLTIILFMLSLYLIDYFQSKKIFIILLLYILIFIGIHFPLDGEVSYFDVGQGDSFLIREPFNKTVNIIDTGGRVNFGKNNSSQYYQSLNTSINYLHSIGISTIDNLCISHQDADHSGDLPAFFTNMHVKRLLIPLGMNNNQKFMNKIKPYLNQTQIVPIKAGDLIRGLPFDIVHPFRSGLGNNHDSMVLDGNFGGLNFLFTGDLDQNGENEIIERFPNLKTDVLKLGHHGSITSSSNHFLDTIKPKIAIISAGRNNRYHHPNNETLVKLKKRNINKYNTQSNGMITYKYISNNGDWSVIMNK